MYRNDLDLHRIWRARARCAGKHLGRHAREIGMVQRVVAISMCLAVSISSGCGDSDADDGDKRLHFNLTALF